MNGRPSGLPPQEGVPQGGIPLGGVSPDGVPQEGGLEPLGRLVSPGNASMEAPLAGSSPLRPWQQPLLEVTPAAKRAGIAAHSFVRRNANNQSNCTHLAGITT